MAEIQRFRSRYRGPATSHPITTTRPATPRTYVNNRAWPNGRRRIVYKPIKRLPCRYVRDLSKQRASGFCRAPLSHLARTKPYATTSALEMPSRQAMARVENRAMATYHLQRQRRASFVSSAPTFSTWMPPLVRPASRPSPVLTARMLVEAPPVSAEKAPEASSLRIDHEVALEHRDAVVEHDAAAEVAGLVLHRRGQRAREGGDAATRPAGHQEKVRLARA